MTPERPMQPETKEKSINPENHTTEAPASMTFKVLFKGIEVLVTNRDTNVSIQPFLEKAKTAITWALDNGFEAPPQRTFYPKKEKVVDYVEGKKCPKCGGGIIKKVSKAGKPFEKCENGKWDFQNNKATGCDFVDWLNPKADWDKREPYSNPKNVISVDDYESYDQHLASIKNE
ncbi:MAG: hypothetical protein US85_C0016G0017 [Candidatus Shapirobacteria bacterium GW2011_GWF1_38_23]|nr:MAG: hypothetical protein US85_C0016G0017 [Candidatus Shapirobacteria bacterium GW2011_GWF1_38_23]